MIFSVFDTHRKSSSFSQAVTGEHEADIIINAAKAEGSSEKVLSVFVGMEADEVGTKETLDNFASQDVGQSSVQFERRKRNMQKEADGEGFKALAKHFGKKHKVIILDPDNIIGPDDIEEGSAEYFIDFFVALPEAFIIGSV